MRKAWQNRLISSVAAFLALANVSAVASFAAESNLQSRADKKSTAAASTVSAVSSAKVSYNTYISKYKDAPAGDSETVITAKNLVGRTTAQVFENYKDSKKTAVYIKEDDTVNFSFNIKSTGLYNIAVEYMAGDDTSGQIEQGILLDGEVPFDEIATVTYYRQYTQEVVFSTNLSGNDVKPDAVEAYIWQQNTLCDITGYIPDAFKFNLNRGKHTLTFSGARGSAAIAKISIAPLPSLQSYAQYKKTANQESENSASAKIEIIEAEHFKYKNSLTVLPETDRTSSTTTPQSASALKLNVLGGDCYKNVGESVTWEFNVNKSGFYKIAPRFKQAYSDGIFTERRLYIDGEVPFKEANNVRFHYDSSWQLNAVGSDSTEYEFYLEKGKHTLCLEATMGDLAEVVSNVKTYLTELNAIYRKIITISGSSPDKYRDYNFDKILPDEIKKMAQIKDKLQQTVDYVNAQAGADGSYTSIIKKVIFELEKMSEKPSTIAKYLEQFKSNLGSMGTWLLSAQSQALQIDKFYILPQEADLPKANSNFFKSLVFSTSCFINSFTTDYSAIGKAASEDSDKTIKVWIQTGRDQAEILRNLIDAKFSADTGINVKLELVASGSLLTSVLSGNAPDVCLNNPVADPINFAVRNAVYDISRFKDFNNVAKQFNKAALQSYTFGGKTYALPETFSFYMFCYRTDIFKEYGFEPPKTWQDLLDLVALLQAQNLEFGMPHDINTYTMLLAQNGGKLYKGEGEEVNINSNAGLNSFIELTEMFTLYDCPTAYDFANRFRSGEMPCGIVDYTMYNQLIAYAPEIKGDWQMIPVPGKQNTDGSINNISVGTGTGAMIMNQSEKKDMAWQFLKWWMSTEIQSSFAIEMESLLGAAAKYATANTDALKNMTWSRAEYTNLLNQMKHVQVVPQVPGGYYLTRVITFAFNRVYNSSGTQNMAENPVEVISDYINEVNAELARKREELLK